MESEQSLLSRISRGDSGAKRDLYVRFAPSAMAIAMRYVADTDVARDVLQDSFVRVLTRLSDFRFRGEGSLRAWVTTIVSHEAVNWLRRESRLTFVDDLPADVAADAEPDVEPIPGSVLQHMIEQLPTGYRTVLNLYVFEGRSHRDIAALLGITENTSASQFSRAKKLLAKMIDDYKRHAND